MTKSFVSCYKSGDPSNTQPNISAPILASGILQLGRRVCGSGCYVIVDIISHSRPKLCISNLIWEGSQLAFVVRAPYIIKPLIFFMIFLFLIFIRFIIYIYPRNWIYKTETARANTCVHQRLDIL